MTEYSRADLCIMDVATSGTGSPLTLGSPASGFLSLPASLDGKTLRYTLRDGANSETCWGVYTHSGTTITRNTLKSTNSDSAISLSGSALAVFGPLREDLETQWLPVLVFDDSQDVATGNGAGDVFVPIPALLNGYNLAGVEAAHQTAGSGTGTTTIQIHNVTQAADMLSTLLTIDSGEKNSTTAATAAVIDTANDDVATADELRIDVDGIPATTAPKGLLLWLKFVKPAP